MRRASALISLLLLSVSSWAQSFERITDQVYMHDGGAAFTCDVFKAKKPNGAAVIFLVSGSWVSSHEGIDPNVAEALTSRGFTCIEVVHGAQPRYKLPDIVKQVTRAVRFAHAKADTFGYSPNKIGITGASAGGHLSLLIAATGDQGDASAKNPFDRFPSAVQAAAVFFPPTDFSNWTADGKPAMTVPLLLAAFGKAFVNDPKTATLEQLDELSKKLSPMTYVSDAMPPTMLVHGDADLLVPVTQSIRFKQRLDELKVPNQLIIEPGKGHGFKGMEVDFAKMIVWFEKYLLASR